MTIAGGAPGRAENGLRRFAGFVLLLTTFALAPVGPSALAAMGPAAHSSKAAKGKPCKKRKAGPRKKCQKKAPQGAGKKRKRDEQQPPAPIPDPDVQPVQAGPPAPPVQEEPSAQVPGADEGPPVPTPIETTIDSGPDEGATLFEGAADFTFSSSLVGASFECSLNSSPFSTCTSPAQHRELASGEYTFLVRASDAAGRVDATPAKRVFRVDLRRAETTITEHPPRMVVPDLNQEVHFTSDDIDATFECRIDGGGFTPCSSPWSIPIGAPGAYSGEVRAVGSNGQPDPTPAEFAFEAAEPEERCGTLVSDETWTTDDLSGVVLTCPLVIPDGVRLKIDPGVFVKSAGGPVIVEGGTLEADGTAAEPVVFTSLADDSVGGDTNGETGHDWEPSTNVVIWQRGKAALDHVRLRHAGEYSLHASGSCSGEGCLANDPNVELTATDTELEDPLRATSVDLSGFDTEGEDSNRFTGPASRRAIFFGDYLIAHQTLTLTPELNATVFGGEVISPSYLRVADGATLRLRPGTFMKTPAYVEGGTLEADGTAAEPVVFTSLADDSVGGDTNGDGSSTVPKEGEGSGIHITGNDSEPLPVNLGYAVIRFAQVGLVVQGKAQVAVRGRFEHNEKAVRACDWEQECAVDASHLYWGSPQGPAPDGHPDFACGAVMTDPYLSSPSGDPVEGNVFGVGNCEGSVSPADQLAEASSNFELSLSEYRIDCGNGFEDACKVTETAQACLSAARQLAAENFPVPVNAEDTAVAVGEEFVKQGSAYLRKSTSLVVSGIGYVTGFTGRLLGVGKTILGLAQAFNQCAP